MARRIRVIEVPRDATMPAENITGPEWTAAQSQIANASSLAELADTRVFDIRKYGDIGTPDDSATFQAAIDAAEAAGGGVVTMPPGTYTFQSGLHLYDRVTLDGPSRASCVLDFTAVTTATAAKRSDGVNYAILAEGQFTSLPALEADVGLHSRTVTFASAPDLAPGDWFCIYNTVDFSFHTERSYYRDGEYCQVKSISGNTVTMTRPTFSHYTASDVTNHKMAPMRTGINGATVLLPQGLYGVGFDKCTSININDCEIIGSNWSNLGIGKSVNIGLANLRSWTLAPTDAANINYALIIGNSQHVSIVNPYLEAERHGLTTGGGSGPGCVPNRDIRVVGGTITCNRDGLTAYGADLHGNIEYAWLDNVFMPAGLHLAGDHVGARGCEVWSGPDGTAVLVNHLLGYDVELDVSVRATRQISDAGLISVAMNNELTRAGGRMRIKADMSIRSLRASGSTLGLHINSTSSVNGDIDAEISGQASSISVGETIWGAWIRASGASSSHRHVTVKCDFHGMGLRIQNAVNTHVRDSVIFYAPQQGIRVQDPAGSDAIVKSTNNQVRNAGFAGIQLSGAGKTASGMIVSHGDEALNCNTTGNASSSAGANIFLAGSPDIVYRDATVGTTQPKPTPTRRDAIISAQRLHESPVANIGSLASYRNNIDTTIDV